MTKGTRATKGQFLAKKLSPTKKKLVKKEFPNWKNERKKREGFPEEMTEELLINFFDFLGDKDDSFVGLMDKFYNSKNYKGTK